MKKLIYLIVLIVVLGLIVPGCIPVVPPAPTEQSEPTILTRGIDIYVATTGSNTGVGSSGDPWATISYAISQASTGDTINVAEGIYDEGSLVFNTNAITLIGSGADATTIITSSNTCGVSVPSGVDDITIKDLTIKEDRSNNGDVCPGGTSRFHLKISHNSGFILENVKLHGPGEEYSCITGLDLNTVQDVTIKNVEITGYSKNGASITAKQSSGDSYSSHNIIFEGITINDNGYPGSTGWAGIAFYTTSTGSVIGDIDSVEFSGTNTISNNPMGIYVENTGGDVNITGTTTLSGNLIPLVATNLGDLSIVDAYAENVFGVPVRLDNAFANPPYSFLVSYWHDVTSAGIAANNLLADGNPVIFNLTNGEWYVVEGMSIQAAIDAAVAGDIINVAMGTYTEDILLNKDITLLGANHDVDPAGGLDRGGESVIVGQVTITADDATVNGFKLDGNRVFVNGASGATVSYNVVANSSMHGIRLESSSPNAQVLYNTISNPNWDGICNYMGNSGVMISHNHITGVTDQPPIVSGMHTGTGIEITYNVISGCTNNKGINYWGGPGAVISYNQISGTTHEAIFSDTKVIVIGNEISDCKHGIVLYPEANECTIKENEISDCDDGILLVVANDNKILENEISGSTYEGIVAWWSSGNLIKENKISGSGYAGIKLGNSCDSEVLENEVNGSIFEGILLFDGSSGNLVKENEVKDSNWGIVLKDDASNNKVLENEISDSGSFDLFWDSSGAGNTWADNEYETSNF